MRRNIIEEMMDYMQNVMGMEYNEAGSYVMLKDSFTFDENSVTVINRITHSEDIPRNIKDVYYSSMMYDRDAVLIWLVLDSINYTGDINLKLDLFLYGKFVKTIREEKFDIKRLVSDMGIISSMTVMHAIEVTAKWGTSKQLTNLIKMLETVPERLDDIVHFARICNTLNVDGINDLENRMIIMRFRNDHGIETKCDFSL